MESPSLAPTTFIVYFFLHLLFYKPFILHYITRFEDEDAICRISYKNKWRGQNIVKLITSPLIKLQFYLGKKKKREKYKLYKLLKIYKRQKQRKAHTHT